MSEENKQRYVKKEFKAQQVEKPFAHAAKLPLENPPPCKKKSKE